MLFLVACQPVATVPKPAHGGTAVEALVGSASTLNPLFEPNDTSRDVDSLIYQGLTTVDAQQNVVGQLASGWTISPDHMTYTFDIRSGVSWADGQPFSADDVLFTFHILQDPEYQQPGAEFWRDIGVASGGPGKVVFSLKAPSAAFPLALRQGIIPKHIFDGLAPAQIAASPYSGIRAIGTGPFEVSAMTSLAINLDRNPYAQPQPYLDHLVLRMYPASDPEMAIRAVLNGAADTVGGIEPSEVAVLQRHSSVSIEDSRMFTNSFVAMNDSGDGARFFADPTVRVALTRAVDRERIINDVFDGKADPDPGPIPTADWAFSSAAANAHPYDQEAAANVLDAAGWKLQPGARLRSKNGVTFEVSLVSAASFPNAEIANEVAAQLAQIGVGVDVRTVPASDLVQKYLLGHHYQMALVSIDVGPDPDQYTLWHSGAAPNSLNFALSRGWGLIDKDLEDGRAAVDPQARLAAYLDFQMQMVDAAPAIFLYAGRYEYAISQRVHGVRVNKVIEPSDRFQHVTDWYVNTGA